MSIGYRLIAATLEDLINELTHNQVSVTIDPLHNTDHFEEDTETEEEDDENEDEGSNAWNFVALRPIQTLLVGDPAPAEAIGLNVVPVLTVESDIQLNPVLKI